MKPGDTIDRYTVVEVLGEGGMAAVYGVRHTTLGTPHALKILKIAGGDVSERLVMEGKVQARLQHPNIVSVSDVLEVGGLPGLLLEYISGPPMDAWLYNHRPSRSEAVRLFKGILAGIAHAHEAGVVHRDLKPGNVMLAIAKDGTVIPKVMDFGLAKSFQKRFRDRETRAGAVMGTPAYMPPEQIRDSAQVDRRADIYALGCMLYELVTHRLPYSDPDMLELFDAIRAGSATPAKHLVPDLEPHIADAIEGMMAPDRRYRISDCAAALEVLEQQTSVDSLTAVATRPSKDGLASPRPFTPSEHSTLPPHTDGARMAAHLARAPMPSLDSILRHEDPAATHDLSDDPRAELSVAPPTADSLQSQPWSLPPERRGWALPLIVLVGLSVVAGGSLAAVGLGGAGLALLSIGEDLEDPVPSEPVPPEPVPSDPEPPVLDPVEDPEPPVLDPVEDPEPVADPVPVTPTPTPSEEHGPAEPTRPDPEPATEPEPTHPVPMATVTVTATEGLEAVHLIDAEGRRFSAGRIPAGTYLVTLDTEYEKGVSASSVVLEEGARTLTCSPRSFRCQVN